MDVLGSSTQLWGGEWCGRLDPPGTWIVVAKDSYFISDEDVFLSGYSVVLQEPEGVWLYNGENETRR